MKTSKFIFLLIVFLSCNLCLYSQASAVGKSLAKKEIRSAVKNKVVEQIAKSAAKAEIKATTKGLTKSETKQLFKKESKNIATKAFKRKAINEVHEEAIELAVKKEAKDNAKKAVTKDLKTSTKSIKPANKQVAKTNSNQSIKKNVQKKAVYKNIPRNNGHWSGTEGNSKWIPDKNYRPPQKVMKGGAVYNNPNNLTWGEIMEKYGIDGIEYRNGVPVFDDFAKFSTNIDYKHLPDDIKMQLLKEKPQRTKLHEMAYDQIAKDNNMPRKELDKIKAELNLVPHETTDGRIILIPREIHDNVAHQGGVSLFRHLYS